MTPTKVCEALVPKTAPSNDSIESLAKFRAKHGSNKSL